MARSPRLTSRMRPVRWVHDLDATSPTTAEYLGALEEVWDTLTPGTAEKMRVTFTAQIARGGGITATQIAQELGLSNVIPVNGMYGRFGHLLADALGLKNKHNNRWWSVLAVSFSTSNEAGHCIWQLREALEEALKQFGPMQDLLAAASSPARRAASGPPAEAATAARPTSQSGTEDTAGAFDPTDTRDMREYVERIVAARPGQGAFRTALLAAYGERCAVTGCTERIALEAAHIMGFRGDHTNVPANGLLLRADLHLLFDAGLMAVNPDSLRVVLVPALQKAGSGYESLQGVRLRSVQRAGAKPNADALRAHFENVFGAIRQARKAA